MINNSDFEGGVLCIDKPNGITSHDVVNKVRKLYNTRKVGHTGTLDPMASGLLIVLVGNCVKASEFLTAENKRYCAEIQLGITTDTEDISGTVLTTSTDIPSDDRFYDICRQFIGTVSQIPPMYSAIKIGGKKLVDLARNGITVERAARDITVHGINPTPTEDKTKYILDIKCSKGTYIRTLCADIGSRLGCGAVMSALRRTENGDFTLADAITLDELECCSYEDKMGLLIPIEKSFENLSIVELPEFFETLARNGCEIYQNKLGTNYETDTLLRVYGKNGFFAVGKVCTFENGSAIKLIKRFNK